MADLVAQRRADLADAKGIQQCTRDASAGTRDYMTKLATGPQYGELIATRRVSSASDRAQERLTRGTCSAFYA